MSTHDRVRCPTCQRIVSARVYPPIGGDGSYLQTFAHKTKGRRCPGGLVFGCPHASEECPHTPEPVARDFVADARDERTEMKKLEWRRSSWKRVIAYVGKIYIEVVRTADPLRRMWRVGEVAGQHHHGERFESEDISAVQERAEKVARRLILDAAKVFNK